MTQSKQKTMGNPVILQVQIAPSAREVVPITEIARAMELHFDGEIHSLRHRFAEDVRHQQVQLETVHETGLGHKFRIITEYDEAFTIVELVDNSNTH
jgi:hypothetical protein